MPYRIAGIGGRAYGSKGLGRMPVPSWLDADDGKIYHSTYGRRWNMCAHSDLPGENTYSGKKKKGQTHWDAPFNFAKLAKMVNDILDPPEPEPEPTVDDTLATALIKPEQLVKLDKNLDEISAAVFNAKKLLPKNTTNKKKEKSQ